MFGVLLLFRVRFPFYFNILVGVYIYWKSWILLELNHFADEMCLQLQFQSNRSRFSKVFWHIRFIRLFWILLMYLSGSGTSTRSRVCNRGNVSSACGTRGKRPRLSGLLIPLQILSQLRCCSFCCFVACDYFPSTIGILSKLSVWRDNEELH